ncbi:MAG: HAD-IA family hydrolase [Eubacteriales bacterium]|nr:HAD-IA family hydrolase [Eubacteriales bacterium]MDD3196842.1 HAD-IA family hydrolase [Eubacteriales bacterium]MDD3503822.1 HAD-IA family hydrolase [Eubacteriales bacterium]MDD4682181.1 HAD-IA family hydrolase [Eubacteriales bacterium]
MTKRNNNVKAVLFDMDGTILDTVPLIVESFQYTYYKHTGQYREDQDIIATIGLPLEKVFSEFAPGLREEMFQTYISHNVKLLPSHIGLFLGMPSLFANLKAAGIKLGIVTSKRIDSANRSIEPFHLDEYFEFILAKEDTSRHKPDPEPLLLAMSKLGVTDSDSVVYVGDSIHDLRCAQNAGCKSVVVDWTYMNKDELRAADPDLWLEKAEDLLKWVVTD